jgi:hypothetical protein
MASSAVFAAYLAVKPGAGWGAILLAYNDINFWYSMQIIATVPLYYLLTHTLPSGSKLMKQSRRAQFYLESCLFLLLF